MKVIIVILILISLVIMTENHTTIVTDNEEPVVIINDNGSTRRICISLQKLSFFISDGISHNVSRQEIITAYESISNPTLPLILVELVLDVKMTEQYRYMNNALFAYIIFNQCMNGYNNESIIIIINGSYA